MPPQLFDTYGRGHDDLRISVTDRCNFRCFYCMPEEGMTWLPHAEILTYEEIARVVRITSELDFVSYHLTGGEPLLRKDMDVLVRKMIEIQPEMDLALTTNGVFLPQMAKRLYEAGLRRVNISLDSLDEKKFFLMTRRDMFKQVMAGIEAAAEAGFEPIKINAVAIKGVTEGELPRFAEWAQKTGHIVRFIEYMPLDADKAWERDKVLTAEEILAGLSTAGGTRPHQGPSFGPRRPLPLRGRPGGGGGHRLGDAPVLPGLQPDPAHRGRHDPDLPLRRRRARPQGPAAGRRAGR